MAKDVKAIKKKKVEAVEIEYSITCCEPNMIDIVDLRQNEKGTFLNSYRIANRLSEPLIIVDEFGNRTILDPDPIKMSGHVALMISKPKCKIEGSDGKCVYINIDRKHFTEYPAIYIRELNVMIGTKTMFEYYDIYHPYSIHSYTNIVKNHIDTLTDILSYLSFSWWVNEPELTSLNYYMNFGTEIVSIPKLNLPNSKTTFNIVCPDKNFSNGIRKYNNREYDLTELKKKDKLEIVYTLGNDDYSFYISTDAATIEREIEQRKKNVKNIISRSDHETLIKTIDARHARELGDAESKAEEKYRNITQELNAKVERLEEENKLMKSIVEKTEKMANVYAKFHSSEADIHQAQAKTVTAQTSVTKEKISIWSDAIKYGLGGLIALATLLITKFAKSK